MSWPLKLTLSSMKGEWIPTRFNTGGVRVFFSVRSLKNKLGGRMNENHQNGRDNCIHKIVHQQHGCTTQLQHSAKSSGCKFVLGGRGGHYQQLWGHGSAVPRFLSTAGLTMRVGGVWAREPKLQQSPRFQPILRQTFGRQITYLVSGISVLHMYCSTRGARFIPLTELEKYCLYTFSEMHVKNGSTLKWDSPEEDHVLALRSWDPSDARAGSQAQAEHKIMLSNPSNGV